MYAIFNKEQNRVLCKYGVMTYWTGKLPLIKELHPIFFNSKLKAKLWAWYCGGLVVKVELAEITEDDCELGNCKYFWVMDKRTNTITKKGRPAIKHLNKARYNLVDWD
jgi:hypothetical protein